MTNLDLRLTTEVDQNMLWFNEETNYNFQPILQPKEIFITVLVSQYSC